VRRHPQVDMLGAHRRLHGPAADKGAGPDFAELDHAQRRLMRDKRAGLQDDRGQQQQRELQRAYHRHGSYRT
jgi:hypothetical protein